jgi:hypothetical protein
MAKLTAWLVTLVGVLMTLQALNIVLPAWLKFDGIVVALAVLVIGIGKLMRNYKIKKKR